MNEAQVIKDVLAASGIVRIGSFRTSLSGKRAVLTADIEPLTAKRPHELCQKLMRKLDALDVPCGVTWDKSRDGGESLRFTLVPLGETR